MIEGAWLVEDHMHGGWSMAINDEHSDSLITTKLPLSPPVPLAVLTLNSCALSWVLTIVLALIIWWSLLQSFSIKQFSQATHSDRLCTFTAQALNSSVELHTVTDYALSLPAMPQIYQWWEHHHLCSFKQSQHSEWVLTVSHPRCTTEWWAHAQGEVEMCDTQRIQLTCWQDSHQGYTVTLRSLLCVEERELFSEDTWSLITNNKMAHTSTLNNE